MCKTYRNILSASYCPEPAAMKANRGKLLCLLVLAAWTLTADGRKAKNGSASLRDHPPRRKTSPKAISLTTTASSQPPGSHDTGGARNASWHAHLHVDQLSNTSAELSEIAYSETRYFLDKIFARYGANTSLPREGLKRLLHNLGLYDEDDEKDDENKNVTSAPSRRRKKSVTHVHTNHSDCHFVPELLWAFHFDDLADLDAGHFLLLCPALIDQLDNTDCHNHHRRQHHRHHQNHQSDDHHTDSEHEKSDTENHHPAIEAVPHGVTDIPAHVWLYSFIAVLVISLVGLLGVAVIPLMRRLFFKSLLQFLISLAVGALSGDALLHLFPHALAEEDNHRADNSSSTDDGHNLRSVWKGLLALLTLLFFFVVERLLHLLTSQRAKRRQKRLANKMSAQGDERADNNGAYLMSPLVLTVHSDDHPGHQRSPEETPVRESNIISDDDDQADESGDNHVAESDRRSSHSHGDLTDHAHDRGHGHSHLSEIPDSVAAVAWMVILGDGIHNFSDGLAIGAAFAGSITGGVSTSVAVFCHELPHEIGDFALLLSSGMSAKQGLAYNVLSSALCFLGMVAGLLLGQVRSASVWIFAAVGGMFLYISLADMLPQLSTSGQQTPREAIKNLAVQCLGILLGSGIMLTIAVFEEDLKNIID